jgi:predicted nucleic acid-binding protein
MKAYWDSSALILATQSDDVRDRLMEQKGFSRPHAICETFSTLTGGKLSSKMDADEAAEIMDALAADLDFVDLTAQEVLSALRSARKRGVRGGRVYDYIHALAAKKAGADALITSDLNDFESLVSGLAIEQITR